MGCVLSFFICAEGMSSIHEDPGGERDAGFACPDKEKRGEEGESRGGVGHES